MTETERGASGEGAPLQKTTTGSSRSTHHIAASITTRQHRPLRRLSDEQLDQLAQSVRNEKQLRREDDTLYQAEVDRHRRKGAHGRGFQLDTMRRLARWP